MSLYCSTTELSVTYPSLNKNQLCFACSTSLLSSQAKMSGEEQDEPGIPDEGQETSLGHVSRDVTTRFIFKIFLKRKMRILTTISFFQDVFKGISS